MKIVVGILLTTFVALVDFKCASGSGEGSSDIKPQQKHKRHQPAQLAESGPTIDIQPHNTVTLIISDRSEFTGVLKPYGSDDHPCWIFSPEHGKIIVYVLMSNGDGWIAEHFERTKPPSHNEYSSFVKAPYPVIIQFHNTPFVAKLKPFNRKRSTLFANRFSEKTHAFLIMPNSIRFSGYFE